MWKDRASALLCGDLNARSNMWIAVGISAQKLASADALQDCLLTPLATQMPTYPAAKPGNLDSMIDLALNSARQIM